jgi:hypothetical protein
VSQTFPHPPQLFVSVVVLTHPDVPQEVSPVPQTHAVTAGVPVVSHVAPVPQTTPQPPQLKSSFVKLTQVAGGPAQRFGDETGQPQTPAVHAPPIGHAFPQTPQSVALVCRSSQPSGHVDVPMGQPHTPAVQDAPGAQDVPHAWQLAGSVCVSVHTAPHRSGFDMEQAHTPALQVAPTAQAVPQVPQLLVSVCVLVHVPPQLSGVVPVQLALSGWVGASLGDVTSFGDGASTGDCWSTPVSFAPLSFAPVSFAPLSIFVPVSAFDPSCFPESCVATGPSTLPSGPPSVSITAVLVPPHPVANARAIAPAHERWFHLEAASVPIRDLP